MKFNERLIELRKREGLSQEDLGYKLNVTRQTVSKWELGITTPEMEKLVEISKLFNVTVDELIKEDSTDYNNYNNYNTYESNFNSEVDGVFTGNENSNGGIKEPKKIKKGWIIAIIVIVILVVSLPFIFVGSVFSNIFKTVTGAFGMAEDIFGTSTEIINQISDTMQDQIDSQMNTTENITEEVPEYFKDVMNQISEGKDKITASKYNGTIELYTGSTLGGFVKNILDEVAKINQTEARKITIKFKDIETEDVNEIRNIKKSIEQHGDYESYCDYDEEGYIYKVTIEESNNNSKQEMVNEMGETMNQLREMMNM